MDPDVIARARVHREVALDRVPVVVLADQLVELVVASGLHQGAPALGEARAVAAALPLERPLTPFTLGPAGMRGRIPPPRHSSGGVAPPRTESDESGGQRRRPPGGLTTTSTSPEEARPCPIRTPIELGSRVRSACSPGCCS